MSRYQKNDVDITLGVLVVLVITAFAPSAVVGTLRYIKNIVLEQNLTGKLKQAADANSVPLAKEKLEECIEWLDDNNLTKGSTHVFIKTPDCDLGFFYDNLVSARNDLEDFSNQPEGDPKTRYLAESNQLMKLRETLLDEDENGTHVTCPPHLATYPSQVFWWWLGIACLVWLAMVAIFGCSKNVWRRAR